jgi:predicted Zn-dependent protease with MMP-like domain
MFSVDEATFDQIVGAGIDAVPEKYLSRLDNVAFVVEDEPSMEQRQRLQLKAYETLFGLYEGIPLTKRGSNYNLVLPDKITIFKKPLEHASANLADLKERVRHTVWHEVAHFFGLEHQQIHRLDGTTPHQD